MQYLFEMCLAHQQCDAFGNALMPILVWLGAIIGAIGVFLPYYKSYVNDDISYVHDRGHNVYNLDPFWMESKRMHCGPIGMVALTLVMAFAGVIVGFILNMGVMIVLILALKWPVTCGVIVGTIIVLASVAKIHRLANRTNKVVNEHINDKKIHRSN